MADQFKVSIKGLNAWDIRLDGISGRIENPRPGLLAVSAFMRRKIATDFRASRDPVTGRKWKKLKSLTLRNRPGGGKGGKPLLDTVSSGLLGSLISGRADIRGRRLRIGTNKIYSRIHQEGGTIRPKNARNLAIPLNREAAIAGGARRWWAQNIDRNPWIFAPKESSIKNRAFIVTSVGERLTFHFLLVKQVIIPRRRYVGTNKRRRDRIAKVFLSTVTR